jgi:hypothetical protein
MPNNALIENALTLICTVALVLGLFHFSNSFYSLWGLLLMMNINYVKKGGE